MDWPSALAVKLNTRDTKGSGAHPGSVLPWTGAQPPGIPTRTGSVQSWCWPGPEVSSPSLGVSPAGGTQAEEATGTGTATSFPNIWGRSEGTPGVSVGQSCPESHQPGLGGSWPRGSSSRQWSVQEELQQSFQWCGHPQADGGESFWSFSVQDSCDALVSTSRPLQCCPQHRRRGGRGTRPGR